jgi:hypothetical protein
MIRTALLALVGMLLGIGLALGLLWLTREVLRWQTAPKVFTIEHGVIYLSLVLGAGFGALCGALAGLASVLLARDRSGSERLHG